MKSRNPKTMMSGQMREGLVSERGAAAALWGRLMFGGVMWVTSSTLVGVVLPAEAAPAPEQPVPEQPAPEQPVPEQSGPEQPAPEQQTESSRRTANEELEAGVEDLRANRIEASLVHLDRVVELSPQSEPYLWQRGIAQYFAGRFAAGRKQFELHRTVNPNDVENATWHFLCVAAEDGVEAARKALLPAPGDQRVPMREVYELYRGTGDEAAVMAAVAREREGTPGRRYARFYADLYIGLLAHAEGKTEKAGKHLRAAAAVSDRNVMADVARVCRDRLVKDAK